MKLSAYNSRRLFYEYGVHVDQEVRKKLEEADWKEITLKLTKYALYKVQRLSFVKGSSLEGTAINVIVEDVVMDAITKLFNGDVKWNLAAKPDLLIFLKCVVKSIVSHLYDNEEYKTTRRFLSLQSEGETISVEVEEMVEPSLTAEDILIEKQIIDKLIVDIDGEKDLEEMFLYIMEGYYKPKEIAEQMGIDVTQVNNMQKRLRRKFKDLHKQKEKVK